MPLVPHVSCRDPKMWMLKTDDPLISRFEYINVNRTSSGYFNPESEKKKR